jgi:hypothetical protein
MVPNVAPPNLGSLLAPILPALPAAAVSPQPATGILPFLSPILRQRVQLLASGSDGWIKQLCYDTTKAAKLAELVSSGALEPHPVSGEVEVDWDYDSQTRYRRLDEETLQALVVLSELGLAFQLIYCVGDSEGGGDGWRVGEVTTADKASPFEQFGGSSTVGDAEKTFEENQSSQKQKPTTTTTTTTSQTNGVSNGSTVKLEAAEDEDEAEDDDDYWAKYDATPGQTPSVEQSGFPARDNAAAAASEIDRRPSADEAYYARYDDVQPAMDSHDPDEAAQQAQMPQPPLGLGTAAAARSEPTKSAPLSAAAIQALNSNNNNARNPEDEDEDERRVRAARIIHPRPESSASSNGSHTVARLEATAGKQEQNEFGVKQHISRSIRSLYLLSRASGIDREEFERLVKTEIDVMGMVEDQD